MYPVSDNCNISKELWFRAMGTFSSTSESYVV